MSCMSIESPDGATGLMNHLTFMSLVTTNQEESMIYQCIRSRNIFIDDITSIELDKTKVMLNGAWIGIHDNPLYMTELLKLLKTNSIINNHTSISWNKLTNEIYVFTDSGRIIRPVYKLINNQMINRKRL